MVKDGQIRERIKQYLGRKHISIRDFERRIGASNGYLKSLKGVPSSEKLSAIFDTFPDISRVWLIAGEGDMYNEMGEREKDKNYRNDYSLIPLYNLDNTDILALTSQSTPFKAERLIPFEKAQEGDIAIRHLGDSMLPSVPSGSIMHLREVRLWRGYFGFGQIYMLVLTDGRRVVGEIRKSEDKPIDNIVLVFGNTQEELPKSLILTVWKVLKILVEFGW